MFAYDATEASILLLMFPLASPHLNTLSTAIRRYKPGSLVPALSGLLTAPEFHANNLRIELAVQLAVAYASGNAKATPQRLTRLVNNQFAGTSVPSAEDPVEDVFIANVSISRGNARIFQGLWHANDYYIQTLLKCLSGAGVCQAYEHCVRSIESLLALSDQVAERLDLARWTKGAGKAGGQIDITPRTRFGARARAVCFTADNLRALDIEESLLSPFIFDISSRERLFKQDSGSSELHTRPLVRVGDLLIFALPSSVGPAVKDYCLQIAADHLPSFADKLNKIQAEQVEHEGMLTLRSHVQSVAPPAPAASLCGQLSFHSWLLHYPPNRYIHIVLLHDDLEQYAKDGPDSLYKLSNTAVRELENYLTQVACGCCDKDDDTSGVTLIVVGGLGRGFLLTIEGRGWPVHWSTGSLSVHDLLTLALDPQDPIIRYWQCLEQRNRAQAMGVKYVDLSGDLNFFAFWKEGGFRCVPRELSPRSGSVVSLIGDFLDAFRHRVRSLNDPHSIQLTNGEFCQCLHIARDSFYKEIQRRSIYVSWDHAQRGELVGVVKTARGNLWISVQSAFSGDSDRSLTYDFWSGLIGISLDLAVRVEGRLARYHTEPVEVILDLHDVNVTASSPRDANATTSQPRVEQLDSRRAKISFPADFLRNFNQPENTGERIAAEAVALAFALTLSGSTSQTSEIARDAAVAVLQDPGARFLHIFESQDDVEALIHRSPLDFYPLPESALGAARLALVKGCAPDDPSDHIADRAEILTVLNCAVDKLWSKIRDRLRLWSRREVIRAALVLCEAYAKDRTHWQRTSRAQLSLYEVSDVMEVSRERENVRTLVSLAARVLIEMAVCESPDSQGRNPSRFDIDDILAHIILMLEVSTDSDAVYEGMSTAPVRLWANGEYEIDRSAIIYLTAQTVSRTLGALGETSHVQHRNSRRHRA